jgi:CheY-like chemotaxis protein
MSHRIAGGESLEDHMADILIAASPEPGAIVKSILAGHNLFCARTLEQAEKLLRERPFDLIICTIVFDESRMFDLLRLAQSRPAWQRIPFVCARVRSRVMKSPLALQAMALSCTVLGAAAFLDVAKFEDPKREMRDAIEGFLKKPSRN